MAEQQKLEFRKINRSAPIEKLTREVEVEKVSKNFTE